MTTQFQKDPIIFKVEETFFLMIKLIGETGLGTDLA